MSDATHADPAGDVPSLNWAEVVGRGAYLVDVRTPEEFAAGHIPGSVNLPLDQLERRRGEIPRPGLVVTVCKAGGGRSGSAAQQLRAWGWPAVYRLTGGIAAWRTTNGC